MRTMGRIVAVLSAVILCSCGTGAPNRPDLSFTGSTAAEKPQQMSVAALSGECRFDLRLDQSCGQVVAVIAAAENMETPAVAFKLTYDPVLYTPLVVQPDTSLNSGDCLVLEATDRPGVVSAAYARPDTGKWSIAKGDAVAQVLFACVPFADSTPRSAVAVPANAGAVSPLVWDADAGELRWYYVNPGDYDQNGEVNVADLLPVAAHFGESGPFDFKSALSVVDGDRDGEISVRDITPIAVNLGNTVNGYNLYASDSVADIPQGYGDLSVIDPLATYQLSEAVNADTPDERLCFSYLPTEEQHNLLFWARPFEQLHNTAQTEGTRSNINGPANAYIPPPDGAEFNFAPAAILNIELHGEHTPLDVTLDGSDSTDTDGVILFYEWDFEGDGLVDAYGPDATIDHTYIYPGTYAPTLRVTDNNGAWDVFRSPEFSADRAEVSNIPPFADLYATATEGEATLTVGLIASGSVDVDGWIVKYEWDFDGDGTIDLDSGMDPTVMYSYLGGGDYGCTVRVTDNAGAHGEAVQLINVSPVTPNQRPHAALTADPSIGFTGLSVLLDASNSFDLDGSIVQYDWDFDSDGVWDGYSESPSVVRHYPQPGVYQIIVRAVDNEGKGGMADVEVMVNEKLLLYDPWLCPGHDPRNLRRTTVLGAQTAELRWVTATEVIYNDALLVGKNGHIYWQFSDRLYETYPNGTSHILPFFIDYRSNSAIGPDGTFYTFGSTIHQPENRLRAYYQTGFLKWSLQCYPVVNSTPVVVSDGTIYVGSSNDLLYAVDPNGSVKWTFPTAGHLVSDIVSGQNGTIYFGTEDTTLYAVNSDGTLHWSFNEGQSNYQKIDRLAIGSDGTIYGTNHSLVNQLYAISPDGELKWQFNAGDYIYAASGLAVGWDGTVYFGGTRGGLHAVDRDGKAKWTFATGGSVESSPAIGSDGTLYFGSSDGYFYAIDHDGNLMWSYDTGAAIEVAPAIGDDGTVYVGNLNNQLFAFGLNEPPEANLEISRKYCNQGESVSLDATGSLDIDGSIVLYEWDFEGDGAWDDSNTTGLEVHTYEDPGRFMVSVRVTDAGGKQGTASIQLIVNEVFELNGQWPSYGCDPRGSHRSQFNGPQSNNVKWTFQTGGPIQGQPVIAMDGTVYFGSFDRNVYSVNPDGTEKWRYATAGQIESSPAIGAEGTVYIGSDDDNLYALNPDGSLQWTFTAGNGFLAPLVVGEDGTIYAGNADYKLYAVNPDGTEQWNYETGSDVETAPAIAVDGTIYFCSRDGNLYAVNPEGSEKWEYNLGDIQESPPVIGSDGTIYVVDSEGLLHAVTPLGEPLAFKPIGLSVASPAIAADGTLYVCMYQKSLIALRLYPDLGFLQLLWNEHFVGNLQSAPAVGADGTIYLGTSTGEVAAVTANGYDLWSYDTGSSIISSPSIGANGTIYIGNDNGMLLAFGN